MAKQENGDEKWYSMGLHFECTQCGNCCSGVPGYVWVDSAEVEEMAKFLGISVEAFAKKYLRRVGNRISLIEKPDYDCIFLERSEKGIGCKIYSARPQQCRTWPFWDYNLSSGDDWLENTRRCPGINRGKKFTFEGIEKIRSKSPC
jgi:Fe-S-cluster containining protein